MKCQKCGKNYANVGYTRIVNGERMELHLCNDCAKEMNINVNLSFGLDDMFSHFFDDFASIRSMAMPSFMGLKSLNRGIDDWMEDSIFEGVPFFKDDLFFGNRLLASSKDELDNVLDGIQKKHQKEKKVIEEKTENQKVEKKNVAETKENKVEDKKQNEINQLKAKIQEYIQSEEYEKAAVLRDRIKKLES